MDDPIAAMRSVADRLDRTGLNYAFVGGGIVSLLMDVPAVFQARFTEDVDVILAVATNVRYSDVEAMMRRVGFDHDMREGAPKCRWLLGNIMVDIMPTDGADLGLNTRGFPEALATATEQAVRGDVRLRLVSAVAFVALKLEAFTDRGNRDYYGSQDLEDLIAVIDGRDRIVEETDATATSLRAQVRDGIRALNGVRDFQDRLAGALSSDAASQARLPLLRRKLTSIATLP